MLLNIANQKVNKQMTKFAEHTGAIRVVKTKNSCKELQINFISLSERDNMANYVHCR